MRFYLFFAIFFVWDLSLFSLLLSIHFTAVCHTRWMEEWKFSFRILCELGIPLCVLCAVARMQHILYVYRQLRYLSSFCLVLPSFFLCFAFVFYSCAQLTFRVFAIFRDVTSILLLFARSVWVFYFSSVRCKSTNDFFLVCGASSPRILRTQNGEMWLRIKIIFFSLVWANNKRKVHFVC